jgi:predicted PurR-regulated permease PerM
MIDPENKQARADFKWRVLVVLSFTFLFALLAGFLIFAIDIILLIFAGVLVGIYLRWLREVVMRYTHLSRGLSLAVVLVFLLAIAGTSSILLAQVVKEQTITIAEELPKSFDKFRAYLLRFSWGDEVAESTEDPEKLISGKDGEKWPQVFSSLAGIFSTTFGIIGGFLVIAVIGVYVAAETDTYFNGILNLVPPAQRQRGQVILLRMGHTLRWWLVGQSVSMLILGVTVFLALWLLNIPGAVVLALFAALMTFIPNLGPVIAYIPTALIALTISPQKLLYVSFFYLIIQNVEGFLITPLVHRKSIAVPPVLIISVQILLLTLIGFMGVLLAMPLIAIIVVLVKMVYVEGILGDRAHGIE